MDQYHVNIYIIGLAICSIPSLIAVIIFALWYFDDIKYRKYLKLAIILNAIYVLLTLIWITISWKFIVVLKDSLEKTEHEWQEADRIILGKCVEDALSMIILVYLYKVCQKFEKYIVVD